MSVKVPRFSDWLKLREDAAGQPAAPRGMTKVSGHTDDLPSGVRSHVDDLSSDYPGHIAQSGEEAPFKAKGKGGKSAAAVAK